MVLSRIQTMKKFFLIITLFMAIPSSSVLCQHADVDNWCNNIEKTASILRKTENTFLKKEILYNGSIIPVAYGEFSYMGDDSNTIILPFLYTYGRITIAKDEFEKMMTTSNSAKVDVLVSFQPVRTSVFQKHVDGPCSITFTLYKMALSEVYHCGNLMWLKSYWAITAMKDCYLVFYHEQSIAGRYYYIPYENPKRKRYEKRLRKLYKKQYEEGFSLLNFFL